MRRDSTLASSVRRGHALALLLLFLVVQSPAAFGAPWGAHPLWDDGRAEVARYRSERTIYGETSVTEAILITVKEDLNASTYTKADPPYAGKDLLPVLKLNIVAEYQTANYPYRFLTSVFVDRNDVRELRKLSTTSQEWCGITFKMVQTWDGAPTLRYHSYWEDQSDGAYAFPGPNRRLLEDQIAVSLRALPFATGYSEDVIFVRSLIGNRAPAPEAVPAVVEVVARERLPLASGDVDAWKVRITGRGLAQTCWFEAAHPNILLRWESGDGRILSLERRERTTYW